MAQAIPPVRRRLPSTPISSAEGMVVQRGLSKKEAGIVTNWIFYEENNQSTGRHNSARHSGRFIPYRIHQHQKMQNSKPTSFQGRLVSTSRFPLHHHLHTSKEEMPSEAPEL
jgi:hypothetical protein